MQSPSAKGLDADPGYARSSVSAPVDHVGQSSKVLVDVVEEHVQGEEEVDAGWIVVKCANKSILTTYKFDDLKMRARSK